MQFSFIFDSFWLNPGHDTKINSNVRVDKSRFPARKIKHLKGVLVVGMSSKLF